MRNRGLAAAAAALALLAACAGPAPAKKKEAQARMEMGVTYLNQRNLPAAMRELTAASSMDPTNAEIDMALGLAYQARGDLGKAESHLRRAIDKRPSYPEAHNNLGVLLAGVGRSDEAIREFRTAADDVLYQTPEMAYCNIGEEYRRRKGWAEAETAYRRAIGANDRYAPAWRGLAATFAATGRDADAAALLGRFVQIVPNFAPAWMDLGAAYARMGKRKDAVEAYRSALANSDDPEIRRQASAAISRLESGAR